METRRKRSSSGEIFSFPSTPTQESQDSDFEFGCLTPDSPSQDPSTNSPADHLFFNGRLLPHSFPFHQRQPPPGALILSPDNVSRATSSTSSVSSRDSLMSSRSNSTDSRRSSSSFTSTSSSRTSLSSEISERRRFLYYYNNKAQCSSRAPMASKMVTAQLYGSSQRWQYLTPVPALKREASQRQNNGGGGGGGRSKKKKKIRTGGGDHHERSKGGICRTIFMAFLFACKECHALEP